MPAKKKIERIYIVVGLLSWLGLTIIDSPELFNAFVEASSIGASLTKNTFLATLTLSVLLFYKIELEGNESGSFNDMFWKLSVTSFVIVLLLTGHNFSATYLHIIWPMPAKDIDSIIEQGIIAATLIFLISCLFVFKRMILYQKTKEALTLWRLFEYLILLSPVLNYLNLSHADILFQLLALPYLLLAIILCANFKWIAYLNVKQKWNDIIYLCLILFLTIVLAWNIINFSIEYQLVTDLTNNILIITLFIFVASYCLLSILVLLFNLPTSSVFEKKFGEVMHFQKLSKSAQLGKTENEVYDLLLESSTTTLMASGAALEIFDEKGEPKCLIFQNFDKEKFLEIKSFNLKNDINIGEDYFLVDDLATLNQFSEIGYMGFLSMLICPLNSYNDKLGNLYLFSEIKQGFEKEMIEIANTYVSQASNSISNFRLINQAVSQARYMRDKEIAKRVQMGLLPSQLLNNQHLEMAAISLSADEVGGDYYDFISLSVTRFAIVIGDVSGKGTSAAFHMAKLKGVFHSLALLDLPPDTFMKHANAALSACLEKSCFITLSILVLDFDKKIMSTCRAGHCPTLYFHGDSLTTEFIQQSGLGLGIIRNHPYSVDFEIVEMPLLKDDIIFLYTDGIAEAINPLGEDFGYDRLADFLLANHKFEIEDIKSNFIRSLEMFCESKVILDDYSLMVIRIR